MMRKDRVKRHTSRRRGFTLVEIMVVIGIIAVLAAIALPAFSAARTAARKAATEATINSITMGLETYRGDEQMGGSYPPSDFRSKQGFTPEVNRVFDPNFGESGPYINIGGASLLVWGLAGADLLGPPIDGFQGNWNLQSHRDPDTDPPGLYALNNQGQPWRSRANAYVDVSSMDFTPRDDDAGVYRIPAAVEAGNPEDALDSVAFLDTFGQPILYYKAKAGRSQNMVTSCGDYLSGPLGCSTSNPPATYSLSDNLNVTGGDPDPTAFSTSGLDFGAGSAHPLSILGWDASESGIWDRYLPTNGSDAEQEATTPSFAYHLRNPNVTARPEPFRADSYILLSAGPDGLYGTADDLANFEVKSGEPD
jgi:prepilin-type N-terminal cleavage/methylation domain-containing protein